MMATGRKILWNSVAPWIGTGYGMQTALFTKRIRDLGHDVAIANTAGLQGRIGGWEGMTVFPADHTPFNKFALRKYAKLHSADGTGQDVQVITLQDVWPWADPTARCGGMVADFKGLNLAAWLPLDHDPVPAATRLSLDEFKPRVIAMSRFGEDRLRQGGYDPLYVPHGIDTNLMVDSSEHKHEIRSEMKIPEGRFVVGMVANNSSISPSRKSFPEVFNAFSLFHAKHPDSFLWLHTDILGLHGGMHLGALAMAYGIPGDSIGFCDQDSMWFGQITSEHMGYVYSAMDVLVNPSYGEGFGIPIIEAQACGTPVIVNNVTSMPELVGAGWMVEGEPWFNASSGGYWQRPYVGDIIARLEDAYQARDDAALRAKAREFAVQYDADHVTDTYWKPALEALDGPREVPPLPFAPNRAMRRAKLKAAA